MAKLFKSRLRKKIESKRIELTKEILKIQDEKAKIRSGLKPAEYCSLVLKEEKLRNDIKLLSELLEK